MLIYLTRKYIPQIFIHPSENKSSGHSSIPLNILSVIPDLIILPLAHIINMSLLTGVYPDLINIVKVIPIHKGGSTQDINYRPISLLNDKIIERLLHKRHYNFLKNITYCIITNLVLEKTQQ